MSDNVAFDEGGTQELVPRPRQEPMTLSRAIMKTGVVSSPGAAAAVLAIGAFLLIVFSLYMFASAVQPAPTLGDDIPGGIQTVY